jgi:RNA polymerase sigma-70 factor, ECF subfamily
MLGSIDDADGALQEAAPRVARPAAIRGPTAATPWLYKIATNACLDLIHRRPTRLYPLDVSPPEAPDVDAPHGPRRESSWVEPYPDERLDVEDGYASPEARYEQREAVELAFIAALHVSIC